MTKKKTDDSDSGVEVYFREGEDKEDEKDPQSKAVKVSNVPRIINPS